MMRLNPGSKTTVKFVINKPESDQSIHIEQVDHGKFARISSTSLLLNVGAFGPALKAGHPVTGSVTSLTRWGRFLRGVSTIRPSSILASRGSPARISSLRRSGPGRTTCPLVETLVCMVRQSYLVLACLCNRDHIYVLEYDPLSLTINAARSSLATTALTWRGASRTPFSRVPRAATAGLSRGDPVAQATVEGSRCLPAILSSRSIRRMRTA